MRGVGGGFARPVYLENRLTDFRFLWHFRITIFSFYCYFWSNFYLKKGYEAILGQFGQIYQLFRKLVLLGPILALKFFPLVEIFQRWPCMKYISSFLNIFFCGLKKKELVFNVQFSVDFFMYFVRQTHHSDPGLYIFTFEEEIGF